MRAFAHALPTLFSIRHGNRWWEVPDIDGNRVDRFPGVVGDQLARGRRHVPERALGGECLVDGGDQNFPLRACASYVRGLAVHVGTIR
jgi:hypothetical protein